MLLYSNQVFIFLLGHLHFFLHFFSTFMENLFKKHPIPQFTDIMTMHSNLLAKIRTSAILETDPELKFFLNDKNPKRGEDQKQAEMGGRKEIQRVTM